jgi:hypothetical protein
MSNRWVAQSVNSKSNSVEHTAPAPQPVLLISPLMPFNMSFPGSWQAVYRIAYEQAQAALAPSRIERLLQPCWN